MNCNTITRKLSAYLDNELPEHELRLIKEHCAECETCAAELRLLSSNESLLREVKPIAISSDFGARFRQKARAEGAGNKRVNLAQLFFERLIPVPLALAVLLTLFSAFATLATVLYAAPGAAQQGSVTTLVRKSFLGCSGTRMLAPLNFSEFCVNCHCVLCACCSKNGSGACQMKGDTCHD